MVEVESKLCNFHGTINIQIVRSPNYMSHNLCKISVALKSFPYGRYNYIALLMGLEIVQPNQCHERSTSNSSPLR